MSMTFKTAAALLGLEDENEMDIEKVRKYYKQVALKFHPDKNPDNVEETSERFKQIGIAYRMFDARIEGQDFDDDNGSDEEFDDDMPIKLFNFVMSQQLVGGKVIFRGGDGSPCECSVCAAMAAARNDTSRCQCSDCRSQYEKMCRRKCEWNVQRASDRETVHREFKESQERERARKAAESEAKHRLFVEKMEKEKELRAAEDLKRDNQNKEKAEKIRIKKETSRCRSSLKRAALEIASSTPSLNPEVLSEFFSRLSHQDIIELHRAVLGECAHSLVLKISLNDAVQELTAKGIPLLGATFSESVSGGGETSPAAEYLDKEAGYGGEAKPNFSPGPLLFAYWLLQDHPPPPSQQWDDFFRKLSQGTPLPPLQPRETVPFPSPTPHKNTTVEEFRGTGSSTHSQGEVRGLLSGGCGEGGGDASYFGALPHPPTNDTQETHHHYPGRIHPKDLPRLEKLLLGHPAGSQNRWQKILSSMNSDVGSGGVKYSKDDCMAAAATLAIPLAQTNKPPPPPRAPEDDFKPALVLKAVPPPPSLPKSHKKNGIKAAGAASSSEGGVKMGSLVTTGNAASTPPRTPERKWLCLACTSENLGDNLQCVECGSERILTPFKDRSTEATTRVAAAASSGKEWTTPGVGEALGSGHHEKKPPKQQQQQQKQKAGSFLPHTPTPTPTLPPSAGVVPMEYYAAVHKVRKLCANKEGNCEYMEHDLGEGYCSVCAVVFAPGFSKTVVSSKASSAPPPPPPPSSSNSPPATAAKMTGYSIAAPQIGMKAEPAKVVVGTSRVPLRQCKSAGCPSPANSEDGYCRTCVVVTAQIAAVSKLKLQHPPLNSNPPFTGPPSSATSTGRAAEGGRGGRGGGGGGGGGGEGNLAQRQLYLSEQKWMQFKPEKAPK